MAIVTDSSKKTKKKAAKFGWKNYDKITIAAILLLLTISIIFVYSTTTYYVLFSYSQSDNPFYFITRHIIFCAVGLAAYFVTSRIPTNFYKKLWIPITLFVMFLMLIPLFFKDSNGAHRWINMGPFSLQPSELAKLVIILMWAVAFATKLDDYKQRHAILMKKQASFKRLAKRFWRSWKYPLVFTGIYFILFRFQSDNGSLVISIGLIVVLLFASGGLPKKANKIFLGLIVVGLIAMASIYIYLSSKSTAELEQIAKNNYVFGRFVSWVNPFTVYGGAGYQLSNSLIAIHQGGFFGRGIGNGIQKQGFLVEGYNDFIMANIIEEGGIFMMIVIYILYLIIITRGYRTAQRSRNSYDTLVATGIITLFFFQAFWNSAGVVGLIPMKGLTAPLLSYGGTSIIIMLSALGIVQRIHIQNKIREQKKSEVTPRA